MVAIPKLTAPQRDVLLNMLRPGEQRIADGKFPPVVKLLALGLIQAREQRFGGVAVSLTPEGVRVREALGVGKPAATP